MTTHLDSSAPPEAKPPDYNRLRLDYRKPIPRPKVRGIAIDFHIHLQAVRHAPPYLAAAQHYGIDRHLTMTPLEEAVGLQRLYPGTFHFIAIPRWHDWGPGFIDRWRDRIDGFHNLGSRIAKFWFAPPAIGDRGWRLDSEQFRPLLRHVVGRRMAVMSHIGDPDAWYAGKYADPRFLGRQAHYEMWENVLAEYYGTPWVGAHLGGNPEDLPRLQRLLDRYPNLYLDCSATKWLVRILSPKRDEAREFFLRNQDRILFGTDQVSNDERNWDFLASRFWVHRKLWETAYIGPSPIYDPDCPPDDQPILRGLALPDACLQKMYHDNPLRLLASVGGTFGP